MKKIKGNNDKCPCCKTGYLYPRITLIFTWWFGWITYDCKNCNAIFKELR
ncbi:MAG: hypothetical protein AABY22_14365 [Nanoarchaeota archaeon]